MYTTCKHTVNTRCAHPIPRIHNHAHHTYHIPLGLCLTQPSHGKPMRGNKIRELFSFPNQPDRTNLTISQHGENSNSKLMQRY